LFKPDKSNGEVLQLDSISEIELPTEFLVARRWQLGPYKNYCLPFFSFKIYCQPNKFASKTVCVPPV
jgi:hypothetical protein